MISLIPQKKLLKSLEIINKMFELCKAPYLSLSFGKDSLVMLDLVYSVKKIPCIFLTAPETQYMHEFDELIDWYKQNKDLDLKVIYLEERGKNKGWDDAEFLKHDGVFMGLRADESRAREITLFKKDNNQIHTGIMRYKGGFRNGQYRCCPLAKWTTIEVETYLKEKNLKVLSIYEKLGFNKRTSARLPRLSVRDACLENIKRTNPDGYNKLKELLCVN